MMRKPAEVHVIDMTSPHARPGFRVGPAELSNEEAWSAMNDACNAIVEKALDVRVDLLALGFAADHSLCKELDAAARRFNINREVVLRDWGASRPEPEQENPR